MLTKKNVAVFTGALGVIIVLLAFANDACYAEVARRAFCDRIFSYLFPIAPFLASIVSPLLALFLVSIFAYFTREEVHSFWFKWMVQWYLPITTALILLTYLGESGGGGSLGAVSGISGTFVLAVLFSLLFIIISLVLIVAKSVSLGKGNK